jgi:hypothetical protein
MKKVIDLKKVIGIINEIYEDTSNIKILQDELEELLAVIDKTNLQYDRGKISKEIFNRDGKKFKKESLKLIKDINKAVSSDLNALNIINDDLAPQKIVKKTVKPIDKTIKRKINNKSKMSKTTGYETSQPVNVVDNNGNKQNQYQGN